MGQGTLQVRLYTTIDNALPLKKIPVLIKETNGIIIYRLNSDDNGLTERVVLYAPDETCSTLEIDTSVCFSVYDVEVIPDKLFRRVIVHGVQIFDGTNSILPIELIPLLIGESELERIQEYWIPYEHGAS